MEVGMQVGEVMTPEPVVVHQADSAEACALRMAQHDLRHLPVVNDDGHLVGLIMDASLARRGALVGVQHLVWVPYDDSDTPLNATDLLVKVDVIAAETDDILDVVRRLLKTSQDAAVICDLSLSPVGIFTEHDVVRSALELVPPGLRAHHVATSPVVCIEATKDAMQCWDRMVAVGMRHIIITEGGRLDGVVALRDLIADDVPSGKYRLAAGDVVRRRPPIYATPDSPLVDVVRRMALDRIGCIPLLDGDHRPLGVVTRTDVARGLVQALEDAANYAR